MLGRDLGESRLEPRIRDHTGERAPLEPVAGLNDALRRRGSCARGSATADLDRHAEEVVRPPPGGLAIERFRDAVQELLHRATAGLAIVFPLSLELGPVEDVRLGCAELASNPDGSSAGSTPGGSATTLTSKP